MSRLFDILRLRFRSLFRRDATDRDLERELRFHLDERVAELIASGEPPEAARRTARREFGSLASIGEQCRDSGARSRGARARGARGRPRAG